MTFSLSQDDVERLISEPARETRIELVQKLGQDLDSTALTNRELRIAEDIIRILARDVERVVREVLSATLRFTPRLPHDVAIQLANDVDTVALPVLSGSVVLTDSDLVTLVRYSSPAKQAAVARRRSVSEIVSEAVIQYGNDVAVSALMKNRSAQVSETGLNRAVDRFGYDETVVTGIVGREMLPVTVAERLAVMVSEHLRQHLVCKHFLSPSIASDIVLEGRETAILKLGRGASAPDLQHLVAQMHHNQRLTPSLLLNAICMGDIAFFEAALAELAFVPTENAQTLIHDAGRNGLPAIYRKAGMPADLFPAFRAAVDTIDGIKFDGDSHELERYQSRIITRVLTQIQGIEIACADYLVDKLGRLTTRIEPAV